MRQIWINLMSSLWFVPGLIVLGAVGLAIALLAVDTYFAQQLEGLWPSLFGAGAEGSRSILSAIAGSIITIAGVVFSITIVALSLASNQYSPRVLRNFMKDRLNQAVLGTFIGIFVYCLIVLRPIRSGPEGVFVPVLSIMGGVVLALIGMGFLIIFIHHIAASIQASHILAAIYRETVKAIDNLFPEDLGRDEEDMPKSAEAAYPPDTRWRTIQAGKSGYIQSVDSDALLKLANKEDLLIRMERGIGEFSVAGTPLVSITGRGSPGRKIVHRLNAIFHVDSYRTVEQDAAFGIRQIVDVALKALSPSMNDTTTAVMCIDYLTAILVRLCCRRIVSPYRFDGARLRVIAIGPSFEFLLGKVVDQIRRSAEGNVVVLEKLVGMFETVASMTSSPRRRQMLRDHAESVAETAARTVPADYDRTKVIRKIGRLIEEIEKGGTPDSADGAPS